jgi:hypothetical protein
LKQLQASSACCEHGKRIEQILFAACELRHVAVESVCRVLQKHVDFHGNQITPVAFQHAARSFSSPIGPDALFRIISMKVAVECQGAFTTT